MCTVTFIARRHGYALGMNRDEKITRIAGLPPVVHRINERTALCPSEPAGGTWVGVNGAGVTLALINWYSVTERVNGTTFSRGDIAKGCLTADTANQVEALLTSFPLERVNPFRLIGVFPQSRAVFEWRWNTRRQIRLAHPWRTAIWISSGFDEPGAQQIRGKTFREALRQSSARSLGWLRRLHRSHAPERGPCSICTHRADATTVSYTEVAVNTATATMRHSQGAPCGGPLGSPLHIALKRNA